MRVLVGIACLLVGITGARAEPAEGQRHFAIAQGHYAAGRYDEALGELQAALAADPQPEYLWAIAQAYRLKGDCARAIPAYGTYLRTGPKPEATKATQKLIDQCTALLGPPEPAPAPSPPVGAPVEPLVIREVQRVHTREVTLPWYRDTWGNLLVGSGLACGIVGTVALVVASTHDSSAAESSTYQTFDVELNARDRAELTGAVALVAGGSLVVGGLLHYALRPKRVRTDIRIDPATGAGASVAWSW